MELVVSPVGPSSEGPYDEEDHYQGEEEVGLFRDQGVDAGRLRDYEQDARYVERRHLAGPSPGGLCRSIVTEDSRAVSVGGCVGLGRLAVVAGILLTGGASQRMGFDKATLMVEGVPNASRLAKLLVRLASPVVEVGPGRSGLPFVLERPRGAGPLVAVSAAGAWLAGNGHNGPALVVACDLPFLDAGVLDALALWPGQGSAVPVVRGRAQPLCARWSAGHLAAARLLVEAGERSMKALVRQPGVELIGEERWPQAFSGRAFADVDTPADLSCFGLGGSWR